MSRLKLFFTIVLISCLGIAMGAKVVGPPARCLAMGPCKAPAPACIDSMDLFTCEPASGAWVSHYSEFPVNLVIGGPVLITGNMTVTLKNANMTFNESLTAFLTVQGHANLSMMNETWNINVNEASIEKFVKVEKAGSTDFSASKRAVFAAQDVALPEKWKLRLVPHPSCHVVKLVSTTPTWGTANVELPSGLKVPGTSFDMFFYTKSECWWWIVLIGSILAYFALLIVVIVAFRFIPALKEWTAKPVFDSQVQSKSSYPNRDAYQLDDISTHVSRDNNLHESDENGDSVRLDI